MRLEEIARAKALDCDTIEIWFADEARDLRSGMRRAKLLGPVRETNCAASKTLLGLNLSW